MIFGKFGDNGELVFEIKLVAVTGERFIVDALLDTGFTTGWLKGVSYSISMKAG